MGSRGSYEKTGGGRGQGAGSRQTKGEMVGRVASDMWGDTLLRWLGGGQTEANPPHLPSRVPNRSAQRGIPVQDCAAHYSTGCHRTEFPVKGGNGGGFEGWNWESVAAVKGINGKCTISNGIMGNDQSEQDQKRAESSKG